ncbi:MAG: transglycosylase domain-containing protein [Gammaproteobacteria bacterium]|nr:transglycosylase domain-containing protein [Gammaproteobacteria bacterium]MDE2274212.1 transglycosylase domain-containing protein [Gammaproteobacteria bacterium]
MGERTIREVLKRRSEDTQRVLQQQRSAKTSGLRRRARGLRSMLIVIVVIIAAVLAYSGWLVNQAINRFAADRVANLTSGNNVALELHSAVQFLPDTLLAATDPNFYNVGNMSVSPLTRRLVRIYFPNSPSVTADLMAIALQYTYSRTDILQNFINEVPVGLDHDRPVHGFAAAGQVYFKKPFAQLQPQDVALLVALATGSTMDPRADPARALILRNAVLQQDVEQQVLNQAQANLFKKTPLDLAPGSP